MPPITPNRITKQTIPSKHSKLSQSIQGNVDRARSAIAALNKAKYDEDRRLFSASQKEAARMRVEAAQRAALDDDLRDQARDQAIAEIKAAETENVVASLRNEYRPKIMKDIRNEVYRKVYNEIRVELRQSLAEKVKTELRNEFKRPVIKELQHALRDEVISELQDAFYDSVIESLKEEYKEAVIHELREELRRDVAVESQTNGILAHDIEEGDDEKLINDNKIGEHKSDKVNNVSPEDSVNPPENEGLQAETPNSCTKTKRRASYGFEDINEDGTRKRPRLAKSDSGRPSTSDGLPAFGIFAMYDPKRPKQAKIDEVIDEEVEHENPGENTRNGEAEEGEEYGETESVEDGEAEGDEEDLENDLEDDFVEDAAVEHATEEQDDDQESDTKQTNGYYNSEDVEDFEVEFEQDEQAAGVEDEEEDAQIADEDEDEAENAETPYYSASREPSTRNSHPYYAASVPHKNKSKKNAALDHQALHGDDLYNYASEDDEREDDGGAEAELEGDAGEYEEYEEYVEYDELDEDGKPTGQILQRTEGTYTFAYADEEGYEDEDGEYDDEYDYESGFTTSGLASGMASGGAGSPSAFMHGATQEDPIEIDLD